MESNFYLFLNLVMLYTSIPDAWTTTPKSPLFDKNQVYRSNGCRNLITKPTDSSTEIKQLRVRPKSVLVFHQ